MKGGKDRSHRRAEEGRTECDLVFGPVIASLSDGYRRGTRSRSHGVTGRLRSGDRIRPRDRRATVIKAEWRLFRVRSGWFGCIVQLIAAFRP
ncbi:hypothetical protein GCM10010177_39680 [Actinomadura citrea]|nr:hypothetical protein GCM10010177_39680 [Actinomadura citrea]